MQAIGGQILTKFSYIFAGLAAFITTGVPAIPANAQSDPEFFERDGTVFAQVQKFRSGCTFIYGDDANDNGLIFSIFPTQRQSMIALHTTTNAGRSGPGFTLGRLEQSGWKDTNVEFRLVRTEGGYLHYRTSFASARLDLDSLERSYAFRVLPQSNSYRGFLIDMTNPLSRKGMIRLRQCLRSFPNHWVNRR